ATSALLMPSSRHAARESPFTILFGPGWRNNARCCSVDRTIVPILTIDIRNRSMLQSMREEKEVVCRWIVRVVLARAHFARWRDRPADPGLFPTCVIPRARA